MRIEVAIGAPWVNTCIHCIANWDLQRWQAPRRFAVTKITTGAPFHLESFPRMLMRGSAEPICQFPNGTRA